MLSLVEKEEGGKGKNKNNRTDTFPLAGAHVSAANTVLMVVTFIAKFVTNSNLSVVTCEVLFFFTLELKVSYFTKKNIVCYDNKKKFVYLRERPLSFSRSPLTSFW